MDDIAAALQQAGVSGAYFSGVSTVLVQATAANVQESLDWQFDAGTLSIEDYAAAALRCVASRGREFVTEVKDR